MKLTLKHTIAAIILMLNLAAPVVAGQLEDGVGAAQHQDYATALRLLRPLADRGDATAQFNLGVMYDAGQGVPQNYPEAVKWFGLAAGQGHAEAQYNLGFMYANGHGVQQDYVRSHMWFFLSAAQGYQEAGKSLYAVARRMTPAQIAEAQKLAREWKPK